MFIGHYGVAFALKKYAPKTSLGILFVAAQLVDIVFFILVPLGIENLRIIPGFTEASPFDLYNYPITHTAESGSFNNGGPQIPLNTGDIVVVVVVVVAVLAVAVFYFWRKRA